MKDNFPQLPINDALIFNQGIILLEDGSGVFTWTPTGTGGDDVHEYATDEAFHGTKCIQMQTRTTSAASGDHIKLQKQFAGPTEDIAYLSWRMKIIGGEFCDYITVLMFWDDGDANNRYELKISPAAGTLQIKDSTSTLQTISDLDLVTDGSWWDYVRLTVDNTTPCIASITANGESADTSDITVPSGAAASGRHLTLSFDAYTNDATPAGLYIDTLYLGTIAGL